MTSILLKNGKVIDAEQMKARKADVLVTGALIYAVEPNIEPPEDIEVLDCEGLYVSAGWTDAHLHIESSMLAPTEFVAESLRCGTTTILVDPHEIANVFGMKAVRMFTELSEELPINMLVGVPSCVPATNMEHSGADITLTDVKSALLNPHVYGLAEMMNYPGIITGTGEARQKVEAALAAGKIADGHCPGLTGDSLASYISNGKNDNRIRISSDHEVTAPQEALEKLAAGMFIALRCGTASKDIDVILPKIAADGRFLDRCMLCSDDLSAAELVAEGHVNRIIGRAARILSDALSLTYEDALIRATALATKTAGDYLALCKESCGLEHIGLIKRGYKADITVFAAQPDTNPMAVHVICSGKCAVRDSVLIARIPKPNYMPFTSSVHIANVSPSSFTVDAPSQCSGSVKVRCIDASPNSLLTDEYIAELSVKDGAVLPSAADNIAALTVLERHGKTGGCFTGFVRGLGISEGAVASTVAHDSHNMLVAGFLPDEMARLANELAAAGGGIGVLRAGKTSLMPLEIGGLMTELSAAEVAKRYAELLSEARSIGAYEASVFMALSFLALPVIPALKITDMGLVDVNKFEFTPLFV